jgi:hypothetical protein
MAHVETAIPDSFAAKPRRPKRRLPRHAFDRRSRPGRRAKLLAQLYRERLKADAADPLLAIQIVKTANLVALSEDLTARAISGADIPADDIVRLNRLCDLNLRRLRLDRHDPRPRTESLDEYVARTYGSSESAT